MSNLKQLKQLRDKVERIDLAIIKKLGQRFKLTKEIQIVKKSLKIPLLQEERELKLLEKYTKLGESLEISKGLIVDIYKKVFSYVRKYGNINRWKNR